MRTNHDLTILEVTADDDSKITPCGSAGNSGGSSSSCCDFDTPSE